MKHFLEQIMRGMIAACLAMAIVAMPACNKPMRPEDLAEAGRGDSGEKVTRKAKPFPSGEEEAAQADEGSGKVAGDEEGGKKEDEAHPNEKEEAAEVVEAGKEGEDIPVVPGSAGVMPEKDETGETGPLSLPADRIFRDSTGRELDATVIGRNSLNLTVVRRADQARFDIAIENLSVEDQAWARTLVFQAAPAARRPSEVAEEIVEEEPPYVKSRRQQIGQLEDKVRRLNLEMKGTSNRTLKKSYAERIKDAEEDIADMVNDIELYEARTGGRR